MTAQVTVSSVETASSESGPISSQTYFLLGITVLVTQAPLLFHLPLLLTLPGIALAIIQLSPVLRKRVRFAPALLTPLVLLTAVAVIAYYGNFFSRDPCVVFLFLLINFKYIETRRTNDASLIIVLCAFLLLTQFFYWQTITAAVLSIPSMFMIGLSLFSVQRGKSTMSLQDMTHMTAKLFLQAMPIAAILFVAVPRLPSAGYGNGSESSATTGLSSTMLPGSVSSLAKSDAVAFRVQFEGTPPSALQSYWRGPVLSGFDGMQWYISPTGNQQYEFPDTALSTGRRLNYTVTVEPTINPWLLALDTPVSLPINRRADGRRTVIGHINHERQINTTKRQRGAYRYHMSSTLTDRFKPLAKPTAETLYTANTNPVTRAHALQLREQYSSDERLVNHILKWFNKEPFHYTLQPQKLGENGIDEFLFSTRRGFCEHYAGSFVFLLRAAGIPARVVTGYQGGEMNGDYMIVRQSDAHAWAEAYINGEWRRYDPTASVAIERVESGFNEALSNELQGLRSRLMQLPLVKSATLQWDALNYKWQTWVIDFDLSTQNSLWKRLGLHKPNGWHIALIIALAGALWAAIIILSGSFSDRRKLDPCEKQWRRLQRKFSPHGIQQSKTETTTTYIERLVRRWPEHRNQLEKLLVAYQHGRFSAAANRESTQHLFAREMREQLLQLGTINKKP